MAFLVMAAVMWVGLMRSTFDALLIDGMHPVNKFRVEIAIGVEIVSEVSVHEDVNNIPEADKEVRSGISSRAAAEFPVP